MTDPAQSRSALKSYFVKNAIPTQAQFADLIDGCLNCADDKITPPRGTGNPLSIGAGLTVTGAAELKGSLTVEKFLTVNGGEMTVNGLLRVPDRSAKASEEGGVVIQEPSIDDLIKARVCSATDSLVVIGSETRVKHLTVMEYMSVGNGLTVHKGDSVMQNLTVNGDLTVTGKITANNGLTVALLNETGYSVKNYCVAIPLPYCTEAGKKPSEVIAHGAGSR